MPKAVGLNRPPPRPARGHSDRLWKAATSCGIAVIAIRRGGDQADRGAESNRESNLATDTQSMTTNSSQNAYHPSRPPAKRSGSYFERGRPNINKVVMTAISMPNMPKRLPRRALTGLDSPSAPE